MNTLASNIRRPSKAQLKLAEDYERRNLRQTALCHAITLKTSTLGPSINHPTLEVANRLYQFMLTGKVSGLSKPPKRSRK